ncbi:MAG: hypothetical protein ACYTF6_11565 [Planctomycetota bacterium]
MMSVSTPVSIAKPWACAVVEGRLGSTVFTALFLGTLYAHFSWLINHDSAWYLYAVDAFLDGGRIYQDIFFEVNPPLAFFLAIPPVYVSRVTGLFPADVFASYVFGLIVLSLILIRGLLSERPQFPPVFRRCLLFAALLALALSPARDFGQREHLMLILSLPYLVLVALRASGAACGRGAALLAGAMAGLGFSLKPHFFLVAAGLELYLLVRRRGLRKAIRTETVAMAAVVTAYCLAVVLLTPDYLTQVLPYAMDVYNNSYRRPLEFVLWRQETLLLPVVVLLNRIARHNEARREFPDVFCVAAGCFFLVYLVQMKGWDYQLYPVSASLVLAVGATLARALADAPAGAAPRPATGTAAGSALIAVAALSGLLGAAIWRGGYRNTFMERMAPIVHEHAAGSAIYVFTTNVSHGFPLVNYAGVTWSSRFPTQWLLPGLERRRRDMTNDTTAEDRARLAEIERYLVDAVVADFRRHRPALVFVDMRRDKPYFGGLEFDYLAFFSADPRFAKIWSRYEPLETTGSYWIYRRRPGGGP